MKTLTIKINPNEKVVICADCKCKSILKKNERHCPVCDSTDIHEAQ
jgi:RNA polymerase subunit RPABC4/transcription elongation factor Spt4